MQVNSISNAQAFSGAEKKPINKRAITAGIVGAAVIAGTVAAGLHGKSIAGPNAGKGLKAIGGFIANGAKDYAKQITKKANDLIAIVKNKIGTGKVDMDYSIRQSNLRTVYDPAEFGKKGLRHQQRVAEGYQEYIGKVFNANA